MNCEQCQLELEDLLYGELDDPRANALRKHLRSCKNCATHQAALEREQEVFVQYYEHTAPEPSDAMWRAIQSQIREESRATTKVTETSVSWWQRLFGGSGWWQQAAFATALVLVSVAATTFYFKWQAQLDQKNVAANATPTPQPSPSLTPETSTPAPKAMTPPPEKHFASQPATKPFKLTEEQVLQNQLARAEREYQQAIKMLDRVIARRRDQLEPAAWQQYQNSLALIDSSIAESRRALQGETADAAVGQFLLTAYGRKLDLMRDIAMQAGQ